jgi:hypothetical protein
MTTKKILLGLFICFVLFIVYRVYYADGTYSDKLTIDLVPFTDESNGCTSVSPDLWVIEQLDNQKYKWLKGEIMYCIKSKVQYKNNKNRIKVIGYLKKRPHSSYIECEKYYIFIDESVEFLK